MIDQFLKVARGDVKADLVIKGKIFSVFSGEVLKTDLAIHDGKIVGIGEYAGKTTIETDGIVLPGFIDGHIHLESTLLNPLEFTKAVIPHGTTTVFSDPHEIANILGIEGIKFMVDVTESLPLNFYFLAPSCVPAIKGFESYGAEITAEDVREILKLKRVIGLAEVMNFPGVIYGSSDVLEKISVSKNKVIDGHAPGLVGNFLNAYIFPGIYSDHECISKDEALEKLRRGMKIMVREGSVAKNLLELAKIITDHSSENFILVSDDLLPTDIKECGHMDYRLKLCINAGIKPEIAIKMATINTAQYFGIKDIGALAPGFRADVVIVSDFDTFDVVTTIKDGDIIWNGKKLNIELHKPEIPQKITQTVNMIEIKKNDISIHAKGKTCRLIEIVPNQIITKASTWDPPIKNGIAFPDPEEDVAKIVVVDRHRQERKIGVGFVKGFGIKSGAIASSVSHDSHNCISVGVNDSDIVLALKRLKEIQGGFVVVEDKKIKAELPLQIAGLMSNLEYNEVAKRLRKCYKAAKDIGILLEHPFTTLSFLALPVIPELKITDYGLVDVKEMRIVDLWVS